MRIKHRSRTSSQSYEVFISNANDIEMKVMKWIAEYVMKRAIGIKRFIILWRGRLVNVAEPPEWIDLVFPADIKRTR